MSEFAYDSVTRYAAAFALIAVFIRLLFIGSRGRNYPPGMHQLPPKPTNVTYCLRSAQALEPFRSLETFISYPQRTFILRTKSGEANVSYRRHFF